MGCDGGTIPKRDELVRKKKKKEEKDKDADLAAKWQHCAISSTKLKEPIVACELGNLYNKDAVIEFLLNRDSYPKDFAEHIRGLKDVTELKLTPKTDYQGSSGKGGEYIDHSNSPFICPVLGSEMSGRYRFVHLRKCGCVFSEKALKEIKGDNCHACGKLFDRTDDVIVLNGSTEDVEVLREKMLQRREKAKNEKKLSKKRKAAESSVGEGVAVERSVIKMKQ